MVEDTLTHVPAKMGVGQSPELLILVGVPWELIEGMTYGFWPPDSGSGVDWSRLVSAIRRARILGHASPLS